MRPAQILERALFVVAPGDSGKHAALFVRSPVFAAVTRGALEPIMYSSETESWQGKVHRSFSRKERGFQDDKGLRGWVETEPMLEGTGKKPRRGAAFRMTNNFLAFGK